uniref:Uncharacterized protein n=1 Tax=Triticum urartu TaxID=4572 RepID=A0A8R7K1R0_TRIUA
MLNDYIPSILEMCFLTFPAHPWQCIATFITTTWRTWSPGATAAVGVAGVRLAAAVSRAGVSTGLLVTIGSVTATGAPRLLDMGGGWGGATRLDETSAAPAPSAPRRTYLTSWRVRASSAIVRSARRPTTMDRASPGTQTAVAACDRHSIPPVLMPATHTNHRAQPSPCSAVTPHASNVALTNNYQHRTGAGVRRRERVALGDLKGTKRWEEVENKVA